jgi:hypothetical protein
MMATVGDDVFLANCSDILEFYTGTYIIARAPEGGVTLIVGALAAFRIT